MAELRNWPSKGYHVIVVDPPWPIRKIVRKVRPNQKPALDYPVMPLEEIYKLPINTIAQEDSVCFLWTIQKYLPHAFPILETWGFKYQRTLTWDKSNGMCLFGFHHRTEFVVFGYKGRLEIYPRRRAMPTLLNEKTGRGLHSVKPQVFYDYASAFGKDRIDLFARRERLEWDVWGDEMGAQRWPKA